MSHEQDLLPMRTGTAATTAGDGGGLARAALVIAILALFIAPMLGYVAGRASVAEAPQGAPGPPGPAGPQGAEGKPGQAGESADLGPIEARVDELASQLAGVGGQVSQLDGRINSMASCVNRYMDVVGSAGNGRYTYIYC